MKVFRAILFDLNGTLVDVWTDESRDDLYRTVANLLCTYGVPLSADGFRERFYALMKEQRAGQGRAHPEFDVLGVFRRILEEDGTAFTRELPPGQRAWLPEFLAHAFRAASLLRLETYPKVREVLELLAGRYALAAVSDAQKLWAEAELRRLDLLRFFPVRVISSDYGFRKPAAELFNSALERLGVTAEEALFVGNDTYRDVCGAAGAGMKCVYFQSNQGDQRAHGCEPDYVIRRFEELPEAVRFLESQASGER